MQKPQESMKVTHPNGISAECIAASVYKGAPPIYTVVTRSPKFLDAEMRTHRILSQNSSSSRAIPVEKIIKQVEDGPFVPHDWRKAQKGMQGDEPLIGAPRRDAEETWRMARHDAISAAKKLAKLGAHKQLVNRLLEPWTWQDKVVTGTEWENFFNLRCHPAAQPEMQALASCIREAIENAEPIDLSDGSWHLPFVLDEERETFPLEWLLDYSAARCARISYANHGTNQIDRIKDLKLATRLSEDGHRTPFEHQARKLRCEDKGIYFRDDAHWSANFRGWFQYRKEIETRG